MATNLTYNCVRICNKSIASSKTKQNTIHTTYDMMCLRMAPLIDRFSESHNNNTKQKHFVPASNSEVLTITTRLRCCIARFIGQYCTKRRASLPVIQVDNRGELSWANTNTSSRRIIIIIYHFHASVHYRSFMAGENDSCPRVICIASFKWIYLRFWCVLCDVVLWLKNMCFFFIKNRNSGCCAAEVDDLRVRSENKQKNHEKQCNGEIISFSKHLIYFYYKIYIFIIWYVLVVFVYILCGRCT